MWVATAILEFERIKSTSECPLSLLEAQTFNSARKEQYLVPLHVSHGNYCRLSYDEHINIVTRDLIASVRIRTTARRQQDHPASTVFLLYHHGKITPF
jgi:hypothetical protein